MDWQSLRDRLHSFSESLFVANGKDGSVRAFDAGSWKMLKSTSYGDDADNLRHDPSNGNVWVGYGGGALGEFDQEGTKLADIKLDAHPESFQLEKSGSRIFINLPRSMKIAVVDRKTRSVSGSWGTGGPSANYPMANYLSCRLNGTIWVCDFAFPC